MNLLRLQCALGLIILIGACQTSLTEAEKNAAWNKYVDTNVVIVDTAMRYELTNTELILEFITPPQLDTWLACISILKGSETIFVTGSDEDNQLDTVRFTNGKLKITGFNLDTLDLTQCRVALFGAPTIPGKILWSEPAFQLTFAMWEKEGQPGILTPWPQFHQVRYLTFDEVYLNTLSQDLQSYCLQRQTVDYFSPDKLSVIEFQLFQP